MSNIKFMVIGDIGAHSGFVEEVDYDTIWTPENPGGWTFQQIEGPHGTRLGEYDTYEQAQIELDEWLECDSVETGRYCYTHNPEGR